jgi:protein involved in polysaccharide export with SLBB domain
MKNRIIHKLLATLVSLAISTTSFAQAGGGMFGGGSDDSMLGGILPRAASNQAPAVPNLIGNTGRQGTPVSDRDALVAQQSLAPVTPAPADPSEFQKYVQSVAGENVQPYGAKFFANTPSTFAPVQNMPVPSDYEYGPGDEILIRAWGGVNIDYRATVDRNGQINIPAVGTITVTGTKASQVEGVIRNAVGKGFTNFQLSVVPGQIRSLRIYVVGHANKPGTYTLSSLSTLVNALFVTGGPAPNGSMRNVQLKRAGRTIATVDLYNFISTGSKTDDITLQDGDTIVIPPIHSQVAILGKVETPAIYELKDNSETIGSLIKFTGGLPVVADQQVATLRQIDPTKKPSVVETTMALDGQALQRKWDRGDILTVLGVSTSIPMAKRNVLVTIDGEVRKPGTYQMKFGDTTQDLIAKAGGITDQAYPYATSFYRQSTRVKQTEAYARLLVRMEATAKAQAATMSQNAGGGSVPGGNEAAMIAQRNQAAFAAAQGQIARLKALKPEGRIALNVDPTDETGDTIPDLALEPGDRLVIPGKMDFVQVYGSVNIETSLLYKPNTTAGDYLKVAGVQKEADTDAIFILRADGMVTSDDNSFFGSDTTSKKIYAGDTVVVPERLDRETKYNAFMRGLKDWTLILGQLGLAAAAIHVLSN